MVSDFHVPQSGLKSVLPHNSFTQTARFTFLRPIPQEHRDPTLRPKIKPGEKEEKGEDRMSWYIARIVWREISLGGWGG